MEIRGKLTLSCALEEEAHNKDLQRGHRNHHQRFNHAEIEDAALSAADGAEVSVFTRAEVLLVPGDCGQLSGELVDGFLQAGGLFRASTLAGWELGTLLVLNLNKKKEKTY